MFFLLPKTPLIIIISLLLMSLSFGYVVWNLWWIERSYWRRISALVILLSGITALGIYVWPNQIRINPNKFTLGGTQIIEIENMQLKTVYSVWIKIKGQTGYFSFDDIDVISENHEEFFSEDLGHVNINYAMEILKGFDANGESCIYLLIFRLKPLESKFIKIKKNKREKKSLPLVLEIRGYSRETPSIPSPLSKNMVVLPAFKPPESFTIKSVSILMKKKH